MLGSLDMAPTFLLTIEALSPYSEIVSERERQDELKAEGRFMHTCADDIPNERRMVILTEEIGEVARALLGEAGAVQDGGDLRKELVQCAAIIVAWLEGLEGGPSDGARG